MIYTNKIKKNIIDFFLIQKEAFKNKVAVIYEDRALTYQELDEVSNQIAHYMLDKKHIEKNSFIGIKLDKNEYLIASILAVLKLSCAYVPINPNYPQERIYYIENDSNCTFVIDRKEMENFLNYPKNSAPVISNALPSDNAYVIYTSGTTGNPKGVVITHKNLINLLLHENTPFDFKSTDVWTVFHSQSFDVSVWEIFAPLLTGATLIMLDDKTVRNPKKVKKIIEERKVTMFSQTPSSFYMLTPVFKSDYKPNYLRYIFFGGEALSPLQLAWWRSVYPELNFINLYGTTETTIHATFKKITDVDIENNISNIGKALPSYYAYVLGKHHEMLPFGVEGELALGGLGLSNQYLNNEVLTNEKYIQNPFSNILGDKLYLTGDIVKKLPNGEMIYIGRKDTQVKIRGHRIELAEIELALLSKPEISYAKAIIKKDKSNQNELLVFIISAIAETADNLVNFLKQKLPAFMIPMYYVQIDALMLNSNGKLDEASLLEKYKMLSVKQQGMTEARDETDKAILTIWEKILDLPNVGIDHNLFEIGGNSIKAISIINEVNNMFNVELPVEVLFNDFTVRHISDEINKILWFTANNQAIVENENQEKETFSI